MRNSVLCAFVLLLTLSVLCCHGVSEGAGIQNNEEEMLATEGKTVKVMYSLSVDGKVIDSTSEGNPFEFEIGNKQVIPGFENAIVGMKTGEKKNFVLTPEEGYGPEDPKGFQEIAKDRLPQEMNPEVGMILQASRPDGQSIPVRIAEVKTDAVVLNFNHPLAGKTLNFDVELIDMR
jgi:FKBP-type peptidyl-prolyl cis-trans isomerase 2